MNAFFIKLIIVIPVVVDLSIIEPLHIYFGELFVV